MPAPYGLQPAGFSLKTAEECRQELTDKFRAFLGDIWDQLPESQISQMIASFSEMLATNWQGQQALWNGTDPRTATGMLLDNMLALANMTRLAATFTEVVVRFTGTNGTVVPPLTTKVSIPGGEQFFVVTGGTIVGTFIDLTCQAYTIGNIKAFANTITQLDTPVAGISAVNNPADPTVQGRDQESDARARARRDLMIQGLGQDSVTSVRAAILNITNVIDAYVFENDTDTVDASNLPPHSWEVVVSGGLDQAIADEIFKHKRLGIATHGLTSVSVLNSQGNSKTIKFSRPTDVPVYMRVVVIVNPLTFPTNGRQLIKEAIVNFANDDLRQGSEVRASRYIPSIATIEGVLEIDEMPFLSIAPGPTVSNTLFFDNRQRPTFATTDITVDVVPG